MTLLKELRKNRKLTQRELANYLNISISYYGQIERGRLPNFKTGLKLQRIFDMDMLELLEAPGKEVA